VLAGRVRRALERGIGASVGVEDSRRGTKGQLVGGTVEVQLAETFLGSSGNCGSHNQSDKFKIRTLETHKGCGTHSYVGALI
jgi:hypothetical protein